MESRVGAARSPAFCKSGDVSASKKGKQPKHSTPVKCSTNRPTQFTLPTAGSLDYSSPHSKQLLKEYEINASHLSPKNMAPILSPDMETKSHISSRNEKLSPSSDACSPVNGMTPNMKAQLTEFENGTILKQRGEIQLLVSELRDRDRELNDMVVSHQRQLSAWDHDRQKILSLEEKCAKLEGSLHERSDNYRTVLAKLRTLESEDLNRSTALNHTQSQLAHISEQHSHISSKLVDTSSANRSLNSTVRDLSTSVGQLEAREQELVTVLKLKDRDLSESSSRVEELNAKLLRLDGLYQASRESQSALKREVAEWKNKYQDAKREVEHLKRALLKLETDCDQQQLEVHKLKQELSTSRKEVIISNEREKRKEQLLDLQRSKQERSDSELNHLRHLYERQQKDLSLLHLNLESTKELLNKQNKMYSPTRSMNHASSIERSYTKSPLMSPDRSYTPSTERSRLTRSPTRSPTGRTSKSPSRLARSSSPSRLARSSSPAYYLADKDTSYSRDPAYKGTSYSRDPIYKDTSYSRDPTNRDLSYSRDPAVKDTSYSRDPAYKDTSYFRDPVYKDTSYSRDPANRDTSYSRDHSPVYSQSHQGDYYHSPYRSTSPGTTSPARIRYSERSRSPGYDQSGSFLGESSRGSRPKGYAYNRSTSPGAVLRRAQLQHEELADMNRGQNDGPSNQHPGRVSGDSHKSPDVKKNEVRDTSLGDSLEVKEDEDEMTREAGGETAGSAAQTGVGTSYLDKAELVSSTSSLDSASGQTHSAPPRNGAEELVSYDVLVEGNHERSQVPLSHNEEYHGEPERAEEGHQSDMDNFFQDRSQSSSRVSSVRGRDTGSVDSRCHSELEAPAEDDTDEVAAIFGDPADDKGASSDAARETTPIDSYRSSSVHSSAGTSVRETDSPATKLHKLLTESRDMVQELEKSATSAENSPPGAASPRDPQQGQEENEGEIVFNPPSDTEC